MLENKNTDYLNRHNRMMSGVEIMVILILFHFGGSRYF